ncbi:MAG: DUF6541 family protein [Propioniciclava sp.]
MEWLIAVPPATLLAAAVLLPGWVVLWLLGWRGVRAVTLAPAVSLGITGLAALTSTVLGWSWGWLSLVGTAALSAIAAKSISWVARRESPDTSATDSWRGPLAATSVVTIIGGIVLWVRHLTNVLPNPDSYSQSYDNVFHLNTIQFIADTRNPGPFLPVNLDSHATTSFFYPTEWHDLVALALPLAGNNSALASTSMLLVTCAIMWPLSILELCLTLGVRQPAAVLSVGVLAASFPAFPFLLLEHGVLYPNLLSYATVPASLALVIALFRTGPIALAIGVRLGFPLLLTLIGLALAHPNGIFVTAALALPVLAAGVVTTFGRLRSAEVSRRQASAWLSLLAVGLLLFVTAWMVLRPTKRQVPPLDIGSALEAAALAATNVGPGNSPPGPPAVVPALLTAAGIVLLLLRPGWRWYVGSVGVGVLLWVAAAGLPESLAREALVGIWYSDLKRLGSVVAIVSIPAAAVAVEVLAGGIRRIRWKSPWAGLLVAVLLPATLLAGTQGNTALNFAVNRARQTYTFATEPCSAGYLFCLNTTDEYALLTELADLTPPDAVILAEPRTGASLAYAFAHRRVLRPYVGTEPSAAERVLLETLDEPGPSQELCAALAATGVTHVLDFGSQALDSSNLTYPGLDALPTAESVTVVAVRGEKRLYSITACR